MPKMMNGAACGCAGGAESCCRVEALVTIDERGQMVLPIEVRKRADIHGGDKLAVVSWQKDGEVCCISLIKAEELTRMVTSFLGPIAQDIAGE